MGSSRSAARLLRFFKKKADKQTTAPSCGAARPRFNNHNLFGILLGFVSKGV